MEQSKMIIKRNLLFWGKYGIQMTAILIGFVLLYGLFFSMGESADSGFWQSANFFAVLIGIMFNYIGPISYGGAIFRWCFHLDQAERKLHGVRSCYMRAMR